jgi:DNA-binding LacI/PurR family transcriptional regulator
MKPDAGSTSTLGILTTLLDMPGWSADGVMKSITPHESKGCKDIPHKAMEVQNLLRKILREDICSRRYSVCLSPMDIQEVARRANVSTATISRVINGSTKVKASTFERVKHIIDDLHYVPNTSARTLRVGKSQLLGLIVSEINNPFFPDLIDDFEARARERGIDVVFTHTNYRSDRLEQCLKRLIERNVDGIAVCTSETNRAAFEYAARHRQPFVLMNQEGVRTPYNNIYVDHMSGALEAIRHLHKLGHRSIGFIAGPSSFDSTSARREAFYSAMKMTRLRVNEEWVIEGDLRMEGGQAAMEQLLRKTPRPTALFCTNDLMAFGALRAAHEHDIAVPEEFSIIGFDNLPVCDMVTPPLSSVEIPRRQIASHAFRMLLKAAGSTQGRKLPTPTVKTTLTLRASTAPPPAK